MDRSMLAVSNSLSSLCNYAINWATQIGPLNTFSLNEVVGIRDRNFVSK